jgi:hypothetical protein
MRFARTLAVVLLCVSVGYAQDSKEKDKIEAAGKAAQAWLVSIDAGKYDQSWDEASALLKEKVTKEQWKQAMMSSRDPLGKSVSRKLERAQYTTRLPSAPDREYVIIQYQSKYEKLESALDTAILTLEMDGKWRIVGFLIKPEE